ncbi:MAG: saccharopine dehydrogenase-like NADP-dependent oxidoreductase [Saprospiraceae bacterium]|jgi:saccharopine dehydrogenase-like NADP-dependent oxidoreductase
MKSILVIGAGRSSTALIQYVLSNAEKHGWFVTVADADPDLAAQKVDNHPFGRGTWLDVTKVNDRRELIERAEVVVSLLPAHLHLEVAQDCIRLKKHLITASYVSNEMYRLGDEARDRDLIFMGEMGLDPGIDHMSAKQKIDEIKEKGGKLIAFRSYTGGLIAPESDDNPWHYKFTWNPRNVVLAGQGTAQYLENGKYKYIPYNRLFQEYWKINIKGMGEYEVCANRDSLLYRGIYGLSDIPNILRGTIRNVGFCDAWNALIKIGLTDGSFPILESKDLTYHSLMEAYLGSKEGTGSVRERIAEFLGESPFSPVMRKLDWLGLFRNKRIGMERATPALILENLLLDKWQLKPEDKDMIIMRHEFEYELDGKRKELTSTLVMKGNNSTDTAMAKLVGVPMGIFVKLVMLGKIKAKGVQIPVMKEVYDPVLEELKELGVEFVEEERDIE